MPVLKRQQHGQIRVTLLVLAVLLGAGIGGVVGYRLDRTLASGLDESKRYAVVLLNGQVYFGTPVRSGLSGGPLRLTDVYYVQTQVNPETRESRNVLVKRGNEWHSPPEMLINPAHILMVEPVGAGSNVEELIRKLRVQSSSPVQK